MRIKVITKKIKKAINNIFNKKNKKVAPTTK